MKQTIFIDMDGVLCDAAKAFIWAKSGHTEIEYPESIPGVFENLDIIPDAFYEVNYLRARYDVWILSAPSVKNPHSYMEKRIWVEKHFDYELAQRLILCGNKGLLRGDYLIDDHVKGKGQDSFGGCRS